MQKTKNRELKTNYFCQSKNTLNNNLIYSNFLSDYCCLKFPFELPLFLVRVKYEGSRFQYAMALYITVFLSALVLGRGQVKWPLSACLVLYPCLSSTGDSCKDKLTGFCEEYTLFRNRIRLHASLSSTLIHDSLVCISSTLLLTEQRSASLAALFYSHTYCHWKHEIKHLTSTINGICTFFTLDFKL